MFALFGQERASFFLALSTDVTLVHHVDHRRSVFVLHVYDVVVIISRYGCRNKHEQGLFDLQQGQNDLLDEIGRHERGFIANGQPSFDSSYRLCVFEKKKREIFLCLSKERHEFVSKLIHKKVCALIFFFLCLLARARLVRHLFFFFG